MVRSIFYLPRINGFRTTVVIQVDQSVERSPFALEQCPCIKPGGRYWHSTRKRLLSDSELARLQGLGFAELRLLGNTTLLKNMVGNSFTAPVVSSLILGIVAALR